jgi:hypothetical protein
MATAERKYKGSLSLGNLELALEAHEQLFGCVTKLEALGGYTIATFDDGDYPPLHSLALLPRIGGAAPALGAGNRHLFNGDAVILGTAMAVAVYRTD